MITVEFTDGVVTATDHATGAVAARPYDLDLSMGANYARAASAAADGARVALADEDTWYRFEVSP